MNTGPRTCSNIQNTLNGDPYCGTCEYQNQIKSPINLGTIATQSKFQHTDLGNAKRLVHHHGENIRYSPESKLWLVWNGKRWEKDITGGIDRKAKQTVISIASEGYSQDILKHAMQSQAAGRIKNMMTLAKTEEGIPVSTKDLDSDKWLLNCQNGTIDLRTGRLMDYRKEDLITKMIPVNYDPDAVCPRFKAFLNQIMNGNKNLIGFLQRAFGYSLTGDISEQCIFFAYGTGANGKSTLFEVLRFLFAEYAQQTDFNTFLQNKNASMTNDLARLKGARFVTAVETEAGKRLSEVIVKQISGGEPITARFLYGEYFEFVPTFKVFWAANHRPDVFGTDNGIWRRIHLIPFDVTITEDQRDTRLPEKLRNELSGILTWCVKGCLEWRKNGLNPPDEVKYATNEYRKEQDSLENFIEECCKLDDNCTIQKSILYETYKKWSEEKSISKKAFGTKMKEKGYTDKKSGNWIWSGITLKES